MLRSVIISDTHSENLAELGGAFIDFIKDADMVVHAGDFDTFNFISELKKSSKELYAVRGNCDGAIDFPQKLLIEKEGLRIGICHGAGSHDSVVERLSYIFYDDRPDIIIFGHTHAPIIKNIEGVTFINPGSVLRNRTFAYGTFCEIILDNGMFEAKILRTDKL